MKTKAPSKTAAKKPGYKHLVTTLSKLSQSMTERVAAVANQGLVLRNWTVGAYIIEFEQDGADRARYGERLLEKLAEDLGKKGVKGLDERTLRHCRSFSLIYPQLQDFLPHQFSKGKVIEILADGSHSSFSPIRGPLDPESKLSIRGPLVPELPSPLSADFIVDLGWSKLLELIRIEDPWKRAFKPEDAGQMNFYLNWFKSRMLQKGDQPPVGILLCTDKDGTEVEFATAGMDQKLFVSRYLTALPTAEQLRSLVEADRAQLSHRR